jgi:pimeloyl-ACP methyl ester carboxylesterase
MRWVVIGMALLAAGCGGAAPSSTAPAVTATTTAEAAAPAPRLRPASCPERLPGFRCATLAVPVHRRGPHAGDGRTLTLDVAIQREPARPARGDLLILSGGPGQPGLQFGPRMADRLRTAAAGHRIVVVDQRGTGRRPLRCPALQRAVGSSDLAIPSRGAVTACADALGTRRDAYATADTVEDLDAMRAALRDDRWTVAGISYGAFVAERYALAHPRQARGVVLDSVVPQDGVELLERVPLRATARVLRAVGGATAVDDLRAVLAAHPELGPALFDAITERSIGVPRLDAVPPALHAAAGGDLTALRALLDEAAREQRGVPVGLFSAGLHAATLCADAPPLWPGGTAATPAARAATLQRLRTTLPAAATAPWPRSTALDQGLLATCSAWPPMPAPPAPARTAVIQAPALLVNGDRDLSTPLEWARAQARRMPGARLVVVHGAGHSILSRETGTTGRDALREFLRHN